MSKLAKILVIFGIVALIGAGIYFGWQRFFAPKPAATTLTPEQAARASGNIVAAPITDRVVNYWINLEDKDIYYVSEDGSIGKLTGAGTENTGSKAGNNVALVQPSPDGNLALFIFGNQQSPAFAVYNTVTKTWQGLPAGTTAAAWDPKGGNRLAYLKDSGASSRLYLFNLLTNTATLALTLSQKDLELAWVVPNAIYLQQKPSAGLVGSVWVFDLKTKTLRTLAQEESGLELDWSSISQRGVKLSDGALSLIDVGNNLLAKIDLLTLPSKCAFADYYIYCAAPFNQADFSAQSIDAYRKKSVGAQDSIYQIPLFDLNKGTPLVPLGIYDSIVAGLKLDAVHLEAWNNNLYFVNRSDGKLYSLPL